VESSIQELAHSIYNDGLLQAVVVTDTEDPDTGEDITELVAGYRRCKAIRYILDNIDPDWTCDTENDSPGMVKATQYSGDLVDAEILNGVENIEREEVDDVDISAWLYRMVEENGWTQSDLAKKVHKSEAWVSTRMTFHKRASELLKRAMRPDFLKSADNPKGGALVAFSTGHQLAKNLSHEDQDKAIEKAIKNHEKLITFEEAERAGDKNLTQRPGKKAREAMRGKAEELQQAGGHPNALGVAMALRWVDGLLSDEELQEIIQWTGTDAPPSQPTAEDDDE
jgi:ParB-like chromosome segregation protein Spo0J